MKEIKFRCWRIDKKEFTYVDLREEIILDSIYALCGKQKQCSNYEKMKCGCVIQQFTGLKDKKGKEIYEGDIVKCCVNMEYKNLIVRYDLPKLGFSFDGLFIFNMKLLKDTTKGHDIEVKGNIYENPELLGESK